MRNLLRNKRITLLQALLMVMALMWGCKKEFTIGNSESNPSWRPISVSEAQDWFANRPPTANFGEEDEKIIVPIQPAWEKALPGHAQSGKEIVIVPLQRDSLIKKNYGNRANVVMLLSKDSTEVINGELLMYHADSAYYATNSNNLSLANFSGQFLFFDLDYNYKYGFVTENGAPVERIDTVTVTSINKAELEERFNPTVDCIAYSELSVYCWTIRECCPFADVDCVTVVETYINCETIGGGGGSGGQGGQGGGPTWGSGGPGGGSGGGSGTPPPNFTDILTQNIPVDVFIANGGVLPAGFTVELAEKLQEYDDQYPLSQEEYYHLKDNPNLIPILLNFCKEHPAPSEGTQQGSSPGEPNDPHLLLDETQLCERFRTIVFECKLTVPQAEWLQGKTSHINNINNFLQSHGDDVDAGQFAQDHIDDMINDPEYEQMVSTSFFWPPIIWEICKELIADKAVDLLFNLIPGFNKKDEIKDAIKALANNSWLEFTWEAAKIVGGQLPWMRALDIGNDLRKLWNKIEPIVDHLGTIGEEAIERAWNIIKNCPLKFNAKAFKYINDVEYPTFGWATSNSWRTNFENYFGSTDLADVNFSDMQVHHAVPRRVQNLYPNLGILDGQMHSVENLRGIPNTATINGQRVHTIITNYRWDPWYNAHPNATLQQIMDYAKEIDDEFGAYFVPPVR